jgi:AcrR family transcriptional regulator
MPLQKISKQELLRNSIRVFRKKGYYRTNMSDLAKESGLTKGAFYHHFSSKADVMLKSLEGTAALFQERVFSIAYRGDLESGEKLELMAQKIFKMFTAEEGGCFFANTILETIQVEETFKAAILAFFEAWKMAFIHIFEAHYSKEEATELVQQIMADMEGSIIFMQLYQDSQLLHKAINRAIAKL